MGRKPWLPSTLLNPCFARSQSALQRGAGWLTWGGTGGSMWQEPPWLETRHIHSQIPGRAQHQRESGEAQEWGREQQRPAEGKAQN